MTEVKEYANKDLHGLSFEEFCKKLNYGVDFDKADTEDKIEYALLMLNLKESPVRYSEATINDYTLKRFDGAALISKRMDGSEWSMINPEHENYQGEFNLNLLDNNIDLKLLNLGASSDSGVRLSRIRSIPIDAKRGICNPSERAMTFYTAFLTNEDKWYTHAQNYKVKSLMQVEGPRLLTLAKERGLDPEQLYRTEAGTFSGKQILNRIANRHDVLIPIPNKPGYYFKNENIDGYRKTEEYRDVSNVYKASLSVAFTFHFEWFAYIRETQNSVGFKIAIQPQNYNEIFSLRNIPEGTARRKALVHFVKQHSRAVRTEKADYTTIVHKYLRGETKFNWNGMEVQIIPSKSDIINTKSKKKFLEK